MSMPSDEPPAEIWERRKLGMEMRQKYELYFASLVFTLAAASVQSASATGARWRLFIEIGSWCCLVIAGIISLWRIRRLSLHEIGYADMQLRGDGSGWSELLMTQLLIRRLGALQNAIFLLGFAGLIVSRAAALLNTP